MSRPRDSYTALQLQTGRRHHLVGQPNSPSLPSSGRAALFTTVYKGTRALRILHTTYYILHTTYYILHTTLHTTHCILHTIYYMLHTTYYILHTTGYSSTSSARFVVDTMPPSTGAVFSSAVGDAPCHAIGRAMAVTWAGLYDTLSGVRSVQWAVGTSATEDDVKPFADVGTGSGNVARYWVPAAGILRPYMTVYHTLRVTDGAGMERTVSSAAIHIVPSNCTASFACLAPSRSATPTPSVTGAASTPAATGVVSWMP